MGRAASKILEQVAPMVQGAREKQVCMRWCGRCLEWVGIACLAILLPPIHAHEHTKTLTVSSIALVKQSPQQAKVLEESRRAERLEKIQEGTSVCERLNVWCGWYDLICVLYWARACARSDDERGGA